MARKQLTDLEKGQFLAWSEAGVTNRKIARRLDRDHETINKLSKKYKQNNSTDRLLGSGRPRITTARDDRRILIEQKKHWGVTAGEIKSRLGIEIHENTIRNRLHENGLFSYWSTKKPFISDANRKLRVAWSKVHITWKPKQWSKVLFSDESPFMLRFGQKHRIWRTHNQRYNFKALSGTVKHLKKINVWGCFAANGVGSLHRVNGILEQIQYREILKKHMIKSSKVLFGEKATNWTFQQDNDPKHTSKSVKAYWRTRESKY